MTPGGVGYEVQVPTALLDRLPEEGREVELDCAMVVRDDAMELFGFGSGRERALFLRLQDASGVGPQLALALLGTLSSGRLVEAIRTRDYDSLEMVTGVGRKTAERIVVDLGDKLDDLQVEETVGAPGGEQESSAVEALVALGYDRMDSQKAVNRAREDADSSFDDTEPLIRAALQHL